ncbi:acyltransferase [Oceanobacillus massiliensis]|uniref:acyltransferase n=1 Tax=Oceanobacillus massiliensis TaxID=1465765 RepID=UPI000289D0E3|nr:hypothetical protein [Oceanobacillus massiliensis]
MRRKRELIEKYSFFINFIIKISRFFPNKFYLKLLKLIRSHDNYLAIFLRYLCLKNCAESCGNNVVVFSNVYFFNIQKLKIGDNVSIHPFCYIESSGGIEIGNDVSIAHNSTLMSEEHIYSNIKKI